MRFDLTPKEEEVIRALTTPHKIQDYLDTVPINFEKDGDTHYSPRSVLVHKKAHCIEGAVFAAAALWYHGSPPLLMDLKAAKGDYDHVIALYKFNGYWGSLSKSNHATIRYRDPVYKSERELVLSYFHEWFPEATGKRTLRSYSVPVDMRKFGKSWVTSEEDLWWLDGVLNKAKHYPIAPDKNIRHVRIADPQEIKSGSITEWDERDPRT